MIERVVVSGDMDAAPTTGPAEDAAKGAIVITADIPLAARAVKAGATVIAPNGKPFTESAIGMTLATRNLMADLRATGAVTSGPKPFRRATARRFSTRSIRRSCGSCARVLDGRARL